MYTLIYKSNFKKSLKKLKNWNHNIFLKVPKILEKLLNWPPFDEIYNVHELNWDYLGFLSINLTWDYRIVFTIDENLKEIKLFFIWSHSQLYK